MVVFVPLVMLVFLAAWCVAVWSAFSVVRLAPTGAKFRAYMNLSWWRFGTLRSEIGPAVEPHIRRYRYAFLVFFAVIISVISVATAMVWQTQS